jgi:tRNA modification GTPase
MERNIVAISTAMGNGGISIIRMSGKGVLKVADKVFSTYNLKPSQFEPRKLYLGNFSCGDIKDKCMCVYFKAPFSYTGEDLIEFHCHGGITLTNNVYECLVDNGCEPATKGEFSKLAFLNGKVTLDEAEGIIDMINAESESELKAGYNLMQGGLKIEVEKLQNTLTELLAKIEVTLDYPEEDLEEETRSNILTELKSIKTRLEDILSTASYGRCVKDGVRVLIYGKTNAGKSSLLNSLLNYNRAIVTDVKGTTRDTLEEMFNYKGYKFILIDSAGIRESNDIVESIGIDKSRSELKSADIVLYILDGSVELDKEDKDIINSLKDKNTILIVNKSDLKQVANVSELPFEKQINISTLTGDNIAELKEMMLEFVTSKNVNNNSIVLTNTRHINSIKKALDRTEDSITSVQDEMTNLDLVSIDIKNIWLELGDITGNSDNEKIIDDIFSKFCVGK